MLDRLKPSYHLNSSTWHPIFGPRQTVNETAEDLAAIVNQQSWQRFYQIPFEEWVQYTFGHSVTSVEDFLHYHTHMLPKVVSSYLHMYPCQVQRYWLATHVSWTFHIFVHLLTSLTGIKQAEPLCASSIFSRPAASLRALETTEASVIVPVSIAG